MQEVVKLERSAIDAGYTVDLGLMQVNSANLQELGLTLEQTVDISVVVLGELRAGFMQSSRQPQNESELRAFLSSSAVIVHDIDENAASLFAELITELRCAGTPIPVNDIWIAAIALREGATVVTYDSHFAKIRRAAMRILSH